MIEAQEKTHKVLQQEYNSLFETTPLRDEDRAYRWLAKRVLKGTGGGGHLMDLACGGGYFLREIGRLSRKKTYLVGIDFSRGALQIARRECPEGRFLLALAERLPFSSQSFDMVSCLGSLEHFLGIPQALQEMKRVIRKEGFLFLLVPNLFWYKDILSTLWSGERVVRNQSHERSATYGEWRAILEGAGLDILQGRKYNGIANSHFKQWLKDFLIPTPLSYHFIFVCRPR